MNQDVNAKQKNPVKRASRPAAEKPIEPLQQLVSDLEGLERLHLMQLKLIREIRRQIADLQKRD